MDEKNRQRSHSINCHHNHRLISFVLLMRIHLAQVWRCCCSRYPRTVLGNSSQTQNLSRKLSRPRYSLVNNGVLRTNCAFYIAWNDFRHRSSKIWHFNLKRLHKNAFILGHDDYRQSHRNILFLSSPTKQRIRFVQKRVGRLDLWWIKRRTGFIFGHDDHSRPLLPNKVQATSYALYGRHGHNDSLDQWSYLQEGR